jgi:hypothetical protein
MVNLTEKESKRNRKSGKSKTQQKKTEQRVEKMKRKITNPFDFHKILKGSNIASRLRR